MIERTVINAHTPIAIPIIEVIEINEIK